MSENDFFLSMRLVSVKEGKWYRGLLTQRDLIPDQNICVSGRLNDGASSSLPKSIPWDYLPRKRKAPFGSSGVDI
jgi:hypothetical protein